MIRSWEFPYGGGEVANHHPPRNAPVGTHVAGCLDGAERVNALSVDVEDYFQVSAFETHVSRDDWDHRPHRLEASVDRILERLADYDVKATFFTLGWVAVRYPGLVRRIVEEGHELASHGWEHTRVNQQSQQQFRADAWRTRSELEQTGGCPVIGYRAPSFSIGRRNLWALQVLDETGYRYSSSIYPIHHDLYGMPDAGRFQFRPCGDSQFLEIPVTTLELAGRKVPCGGGGYFRLFPYAFSRWALRRVNRRDGESCIFYFHPWEVDPLQPRQPGLATKTRLRHYLNLHRMDERLTRLLRDFRWGRVDEVFGLRRGRQV
jgi:polysaccharide deacetylase family protein (PEP-CTERM system associated)